MGSGSACKACGKQDASKTGAEVYSTQGGVAHKPSYGLSLRYLTGKAGETGFGSKTTAEEVAASWAGAGTVAVVTGAAAGLGYETCRVLASKGCEVVATVRSQARADETAERLRRDVPGCCVRGMSLDLASLASVREFAAAFEKTGLKLNMLLLNAGVMASPLERTADGYELQWGTNHLGHFALTQLLLPNMEAAARASGRQGRVVATSSMGHHLFEVPGGINFEALRSCEQYDPMKAYGVSKLSNILFARELNERLKASGAPVVAVSCHPGVILDTDLQRHMAKGMGLGMRLMMKALQGVAKTIPQGASTQVLLATAASVSGGDYYSDNNLFPSSKASHDRALGRRLWEYSEQAVQAQ